jgi:hypothetical protein
VQRTWLDLLVAASIDGSKVRCKFILVRVFFMGYHSAVHTVEATQFIDFLFFWFNSLIVYNLTVMTT